MIPGVPRGGMGGGLLGALGNLFRRQRPGAAAPAAPAQTTTAGASPVLNDPVVTTLNQALAREQPQPVPTEAEQLKQEQHQAWANYDFERCIVIFSRLHELEPNDPNWQDKLKVSYFNRGKQYESEGNVERATQCYYAALSLDPDFTEAKEAAEQFLEKQGASPTG